MKFFAIFVIILYSSFVESKPKYSIGPCNDACKAITVSNFTVDQIAGIWYRYALIDFPVLDIATCTYDIFTPVDNSTVNIEINSIIYGELSDHTIQVEYQPDGSHTDYVTAFKLPMNTRIVYLDSITMAVVGCQQKSNNSKSKSAFYVKLFTRIPYPSCDALEPAFEALESCKVPRDTLKLEERRHCQACDKDSDDYEDEDK